MSYVELYVHCVWGTKEKYPYLDQELLPKIITHILENAHKKDIHILELNGHKDHVHCLMQLSADMSLSKAVQLLKGESSFWVNQQKLTKVKFEWANEYYGASVSKSNCNSVGHYIQNQQEHHRKVTFTEEVDAFIKSL